MLRFSRTTGFSVDTGHRARDTGKRVSRSQCDSERWIPTVIVTGNLFDTVEKNSRASFRLLVFFLTRLVQGGIVFMCTCKVCASSVLRMQIPKCAHVADTQRDLSMGWRRCLGSLKLYVSFAKEPYKRDDNLQKRPIF